MEWFKFGIQFVIFLVGVVVFLGCVFTIFLDMTSRKHNSKPVIRDRQQDDKPNASS